jgi:hypothetical protein
MPKDPEVVQKFETAGVEPLSMTETEFAELVRKDRRLWHPLIRDLNLSAEPCRRVASAAAAARTREQELNAQESGLDGCIARQLLRRSLPRYPTALEDVVPVRERQKMFDVLVDDKDGQS